MKFWLLTGAFAAIHFSGRLAEYILIGMRPLEDALSDLSLLLVPLMSLWQMVPLFYFYLVCNVFAHWFSQLKHALRRY